MKKLMAFVLAFGFFTLATAQSLEEIIEKHFVVTGQAKLSEVQTVISKGKILQSGFEIPVEIYQKRPYKMRLEGNFQGMTFIQVVEDDKGWGINPFMGSNDPVDLTDDQLDAAKDQAVIDGPIKNSLDKGYEFELLENEKFNDINCFVVKVTKKNGDEAKFFIDTEDFLLVKIDAQTSVMGSKTASSNVLSDYREVGGILMPFSTETIVGGQTVLQIVMDSYTLNEEVDDIYFKKPTE